MKNTLACLSVIACCGILHVRGQDLKIPEASTYAHIEQDLGLGKISISYSRPNTINRKIFDGLEPYGRVWRTGANAATKISFTDTVRIQDKQLVPGVYALFTIPDASEWTIIFNKTAEQWGAYSYDSTQDALRIKVPAKQLTEKMETFTIQPVNVFSDRCDLQLSWENTTLLVHISVDVDQKIMANIDRAMMGQKKPYFQAAVYYYNHDKDMNKALEWITAYDKQRPGAEDIKYWVAKIALKKGDKKLAISMATEGLELATKGNDAEYIRLNREVLKAAGQ